MQIAEIAEVSSEEASEEVVFKARAITKINKIIVVAVSVAIKMVETTISEAADVSVEIVETTTSVPYAPS